MHCSEVENLKMAHAQVLTTKDDQIVRLHDELRALREMAKPQDTLSDLQRLGEVVMSSSRSRRLGEPRRRRWLSPSPPSIV